MNLKQLKIYLKKIIAFLRKPIDWVTIVFNNKGNHHTKKKIILITLISLVIIYSLVQGIKNYHEERQIAGLQRWIAKNGYEISLPELKVDVSDWQTYHSEEFDFSFKHPKNWEVSFGKTRLKSEILKPLHWDNSGIKGKVDSSGGLCISQKDTKKEQRCGIRFKKVIPRWRGTNAWLLWMEEEKNDFLDYNEQPAYLFIDEQFFIGGGGDYKFRVHDNNMIRLKHPLNPKYQDIFAGILHTLKFDKDFDATKN